jgi:pilus assembly protein CpaE
MSELLTPATAILLPASSIAVYSIDSATLQAARDLEQDWRFARVEIYTQEGSVQAAIDNYKESSSPSLIIIQTETIDNTFTDQLAELAGLCDEGTSAIVVGPDNDVNLYRRLIDMGVSDYLVKPLETPVLAEVIAKSLIAKIGVTGSRLIAFIGAKGGVGASSLARASACGVSEILGQKTVLLDAAGGWSTLGVGFGFEPTASLAQAVRAAENDDETNLKRMLHKASEKLSVLATGIDAMFEASPDAEQFEKLIDMLMIRYPAVLIDLSQADDFLQKTVLTRANQIIVVATPTLSALRQARTLIQEVKDIRGGDEGSVELVINMQGLSSAHEVSKDDIQKALERLPAAIIPFDAKMFLGNENESRKLSDDKVARILIEKNLIPFLAKVLDLDAKVDKEAPVVKAGMLGGILGKLKNKS